MLKLYLVKFEARKTYHFQTRPRGICGQMQDVSTVKGKLTWF